jgi:hypothetical protein
VLLSHKRHQMFDALYGLSHPRTNATVKLVSQLFVWPGMGKDCCAWARTCMLCQISKVTSHVRSFLRNFGLPSAHFEHMHFDLIRPLPSSSGCQYCFTTINMYIHWPLVRNNRGGSQKSFYILLDLPLRVPTSDHHGPRTTI